MYFFDIIINSKNDVMAFRYAILQIRLFDILLKDSDKLTVDPKIKNALIYLMRAFFWRMLRVLLYIHHSQLS